MLTVVFTDLVASTAMRTSIGDTDADDIQRSHDRILTQAFDDHGGMVVKSLGDGLMALFGACSDAIAATIAAQQGLMRWNRNRATTIAIRVGVSVGEIEVDHEPRFDVRGTPVVEAARLCATADAGQILCSSIVRMMAGTRTTAVMRAVGSLTLKGLAAPLETDEIEWRDVPATGPLALPPLVDAARDAPVVGQAEEMKVLEHAWKEVRAGSRRAVLVSGDAGAGKTTLVTRWALAEHGRGAIVCLGRCTEDLGAPYGPFVEAIRHHAMASVSDDELDKIGRRVPNLMRLLPELSNEREEIDAASPEQQQYEMFVAVAAWLRMIASDHPAILILDDLHWASQTTCRLIRNLLENPVPERWLIIGTFRATDIGHEHPLTATLADLRRTAGVERLEMRPLSTGEVGELAAVYTPGADIERARTNVELARDIRGHCGGNALFTSQLLRHLVEEGTLVASEGVLHLTRPVVTAGVPDSVREVITRRLGRLGGDARRVLTAAAVIGPEFDVWLLASVAERSSADVLDVLDGAEQLHLVRPHGSEAADHYRFAHALVSDCLSADAPRGLRAQLHHRTGTVLAGRADARSDHSRIAGHLLAGAAAGDPLDAARACLRAGDQALDGVAPDEAVTWFGHALDLQATGVADEQDRCRTLIRLGTAERHAGHKQSRATLLMASELALRLEDTELLASAALANHHGAHSFYGRVDTERLHYLRQALSRYPNEDSTTRARLLALIAVEMVFDDFDGARLPIAAEALAMARRTGDANVLLDVISHYWHAASAIDDSIMWDHVGEESMELASRIGTPAARLAALGYKRGAAGRHGDIPTMAACLAEAEGLAEKVGPYAMAGWPAAVRPMLAIWRGDLDGAERSINEIIRTRWVMPNTKLFALTQLVEVRRWQGRFSEIADETIRVAVGAGIRGEMCLVAHRIEEAQQAWTQVRNIPLSHDLRTTPSPAGQLVVRTSLTAAFGDPDEVRETLAAWDGVGDIFLHPLVPRPAGWHFRALLYARLGDQINRDESFRRAVECHDRVGAPLLAALSRLEWAEALNDSGAPHAETAALVADAVSIADPLGARWIAQRARPLLEAKIR